MSFLNRLVNQAVSGLVRRMQPSASTVYSVQEIDVGQIAKYTMVMQEDRFTLYKDANGHVAVLQFPAAKAFTMFQGIAESVEAQEAFTLFSYKLQLLAHSSGSRLMDKATLQLFSDILLEHPTWSCAHIAAKMKMCEVLANKDILGEINLVDEVLGVTPVMVALESGDADCVKELIIRGAKLDIVDRSGQNVFHYAVKAASPALIHMLASKDKSMIDGFCAVGETALHAACLSAAADCVEQLLRWGADPLRTASTRFPIHCAVKVADKKCILQLLRWSSKQVNQNDHLYGGTPLHWAKTRETVYALCEGGADMEARSATDETPLHIMIRRQRYDCALGLIIKGASAAAIGMGGNSTVQMAVEADSLDLAKLMIVFGADVNHGNAEGYTARHQAANLTGKNMDVILYTLHQVGARRCTDVLEFPPVRKGTMAVENFSTNLPSNKLPCKDGCSAKGKYDGKPAMIPLNIHYCSRSQLAASQSLPDIAIAAAATHSLSAPGASPLDMGKETRPAGDRLLSLDGGGIRGLVLMQTLMAVEKVTGQSIKNCFDWIAGTSTGAILALGLLHGKSLRYLQGLFFELKNEVFVGNRPYKSEPFEAFLKREFGEFTRMTDVEAPKVMVTGVLADRLPAELHLFRNYDVPGIDVRSSSIAINSKITFEPVKRPNEQLVWMAARASGAAPTFFRAHGRFLDGGLMANNPTLDLLTEIYQYNTALKSLGRDPEVRSIGVVVSVGTGCMPTKKADHSVDVYRPEGLLDFAKVVYGAKNLGQLLIEQATDSDGQVVDRAVAWCSMINVPYVRLSPPLTEEVSLDCSDDRQLVNMLWETQAYLHIHWDRIEQLARLLRP